MSAYSAPERNTGAFISGYHPKKIVSTDHTHSGFGVGDVKKSSSNAFTGINSFSNETTFTNTNPIFLETDGGSTTLKFKESDTTHGTIEFRTADIADGDLRILANRVALKTSAGTDAVSISSDKMTTTSLPECSATPSTANQLVNKTYADTKVGKSGDETIAGVKTFSGNAIFNANVGIGASPTTKLDVIDDGAVMFASSSSVHSSIKSVAGAKLILNNRSLNDDSPSTDETKSHGKIIWAGHNRSKPSAYIEATSDGWDDAGNLKFAVSAGSGGASEKLCIYGSNGYVGIGTSSPSYPLEIDGGVSTTFNSRYFRRTQNLTENTSISITTSLYTSAGIISAGLIGAISDRRIKKDIIELNDDTALQQIRLLKPSTYKYRDVSKGAEEVIGFIAQEVKDAIPQAVKQATGDIPNIMFMGAGSLDSSNNHILTIPDYDTSSLEVDASGNIFTKLKIIIDENDADRELYVSIQEVVSATEIKVEMLDNEITELPSEVFIYGQEVDNKSILVKDRIFAVGMSALQEVDRQLQAEKAKVSALEARISALENPTT